MTKSITERKANISGKPKHSLDANRADTNSKNKQRRNAATVRRLKMYKVMPKRDSKGNLISNEFQSKELPDTRIQPDRRWFGNTRTIHQSELDDFRYAFQNHTSNRYNIILKEKKLPMSLIPNHNKVRVWHCFMKAAGCHDVFEKKRDDDAAGGDIVLKGVVRVKNLQDALEHIAEVLKRVKKEHLQRTYQIQDREDDNDFLVQLCKSSGKLLKGGEPDLT
ncbi:hypothetical protein ACLB2K_055228 [Fragaria x ananassa]